MSLTEETARDLLIAACQKLGLDPTGATLIRIGSNAVYRLREPVIVRIARERGLLDDAQKQVAVARWLESSDYPATRALNLDQPIEADGHAVTAWRSVSDREEYAPIGQVAALIRRLHELELPAGLSIPQFEPFKLLDEKLGHLHAIDDRDAKFLRDRATEVRERYERLTFPLEFGPIHGDANVGNVILDSNHRPVLIDLDGFALGHREWDLVQTALFFERFGWHTAEEYRTFADIYGFDVMSWLGYPVLADYRELAMTLWLAGKADGNSDVTTEVHKRVKTIQTGGSRRDWAPF